MRSTDGACPPSPQHTGVAVQRLEGDEPIHRLVILEFPNMEQLTAFYNSPEYRALLIMRQGAAKSNLLAIEGV